MKSKDKSKEIDIKNYTCDYFDHIIGVIDRDSYFDFNDLLLDEILYKEKDKNILIHEISYKTSRNAK